MRPIKPHQARPYLTRFPDSFGAGGWPSGRPFLPLRTSSPVPWQPGTRRPRLPGLSSLPELLANQYIVLLLNSFRHNILQYSQRRLTSVTSRLVEEHRCTGLSEIISDSKKTF